MPSVTSSYIGIDQSLTSTGIAVVGLNTACELIQPPDKLYGVKRLAYIRDSVREFVTKYGPSSFACIEGPSIKSTNRADELGQLRGVLRLALYDWHLPHRMIAPTVVKKFGARTGSASKGKMLRAAEKEFELMLGEQDDLADALWLAKLAWALNDDNLKLTRPQLEVVYGIRNPKPKKRPERTPRVLDI
jgi:Holliday junction resolvasome RuvABC endonuclease subunit